MNYSSNISPALKQRQAKDEFPILIIVDTPKDNCKSQQIFKRSSFEGNRKRQKAGRNWRGFDL